MENHAFSYPTSIRRPC